MRAHSMFVLCIAFAPGMVAAEVYRCPGNVYQDAPCAGGKGRIVPGADSRTNVLSMDLENPVTLMRLRDRERENSRGPYVAGISMAPRMTVSPPPSSRPVWPPPVSPHCCVPWRPYVPPHLDVRPLPIYPLRGPRY